MTAMAKVLIIEDETVLRASLAHGLSKTGELQVRDAGSLDRALEIIDQESPDIVISDIDLPGRTGIELLGELGKRGLMVPIIYVSAYLNAYGAQIPQHANIEVLEKPVALEELRQLINAKLTTTDGEEPFSIPDFLQLASMGRRSVVIEAQWPDGKAGAITVHSGEVWSATFGNLTGIEAFVQVAWRQGAKTHCRTLSSDPGVRTLEGMAERLLMDTARVMDEQSHHTAGPSATDGDRRSSDPPFRQELLSDEEFALTETIPPTTARAASDTEHPFGEAFSRQLDHGVSALLAKDFATALAAFKAAHGIDPEHPLVNANLKRLRELGYGNGEE